MLVRAQQLKHLYSLAITGQKLSEAKRDEKHWQILKARTIPELNKVYTTSYEEFFKNEELWEQIVAKRKKNLERKQAKSGDYKIVLEDGTVLDKEDIREGGYEIPLFL